LAPLAAFSCANRLFSIVPSEHQSLARLAAFGPYEVGLKSKAPFGFNPKNVIGGAHAFARGSIAQNSHRSAMDLLDDNRLRRKAFRSSTYADFRPVHSRF
jgi:hypothetical protein